MKAVLHLFVLVKTANWFTYELVVYVTHINGNDAYCSEIMRNGYKDP
jgi:hypothetical protein